HFIPQRAIGYQSPIDALKSWYAQQPELFVKQVYKQAELDIYSYAFGELLTLSLYGLYQEEGDAFIGKYLTLLAAGGSQSPAELLAPLGFDIGDARFWQRGLAVIDGYMAMLE
ncbi:MAG: M3 family metallopeptidase, partial [Desulfobulbaceae bacterium]|nr:M3 family metallopeptidase [Desulfobulbaceae bacterium]